MGSPPPMPLPHTFILTLSYPTSNTNIAFKGQTTRHGAFKYEKAIPDPVCGNTASRVLLPFIYAYVCLHRSEQKNRHLLVGWENYFFTQSHRGLIHTYIYLYMARNGCAICRLCDSANVRANSSFIEMISNGRNPY